MAKFKVGDRVRIIGEAEHTPRPGFVGREGVIVRASVKPDSWVVDFGVAINHFPNRGGLSQSEGWFYSCWLEPITDTWAQDKVSQLIKQCMPVAA